MAKRVARKIKRAGKVACQFKFTSTFEYIDLECKGGWRPDNLKVIWLRSHRRAQSINVEWVCMEDKGPNGASGRAVFDPPISASLIVTLYKDSKKPYEEKEYKYYIENEGPGGKKILASFTCDMAEYAGIPSSRHALEMNFKPISAKIKKSYLGITLESEFIKQGHANDDDMQSTFSAVEPGGEEMVFADEVEDEEDEDDLDEAATLSKKIIANMTTDANNDVEGSVLLLGTGETLKRSAVDTQAPPPKPPRTSSIADLLEAVELESKIDDSTKNENNNEGGVKDEIEEGGVDIEKEGGVKENNEGGVKDEIEEGGVDIEKDKENNEGGVKDEIEEGEVDNDKEGGVKEENNEGGVKDEIEEGGVKAADEFTENGEDKQKSKSNRVNELEIEGNGVTKDDSVPTNSKSMSSQLDRNNSTTTNEFTTIDTNPVTHDNAIVNQSNQCDNNIPAVITQSPSTEPVTDDTVVDPSPEPELTNQDTVPPTEDVTTPTPDKEDTPPKTEVANQSNDAAPVAAPIDTLSWLEDIELVDHSDSPISLDRLASSDVLAFYFSASWCPPCKSFLPNLKKFYTALKDNNKSFELIYVSSDYSREEMVAYMSEVSMPWTAIRYGHKLADKLRQDYAVRVIPILVVVSKAGKLLEQNAKKQVDKAANSSNAACIQLYSNWMEKLSNPLAAVEDEDSVKPKSGGIMTSIKKALSKDEKTVSIPKSNSIDELREATESKTPKSKINSGGNKEDLLRQLQEKEDVIRQLEEVNLSLKHTNDDLNNEVRNLKSRVELLNDEVKSMRETDAQKKESDEMLKEYLKLQGWLFKRGAKGPTANKWRRRFFRLDQGSKLYYYKNHTEGTPQGFIDLLKVISVMELSASLQDKNNASFNIECEGRTYQLQAYDEAEMRRWITAISKLKEFYTKQAASQDNE